MRGEQQSPSRLHDDELEGRRGVRHGGEPLVRRGLPEVGVGAVARLSRRGEAGPEGAGERGGAWGGWAVEHERLVVGGKRGEAQGGKKELTRWFRRRR